MKKVEFELAEQFREGFYKLPKDGVKILGAVNAIIFSYFADKEQYVKSELKSKEQKIPAQITFYCTVSKMMRELGLSKNTILKAIAFFENLGIFTSYKDETNMKFYTIHNDKLEAFLANNGYVKKEKQCPKNSGANAELGAKNELDAGANFALPPGAKNEPHIRTDNITRTNIIKTDKEICCEKSFDFLFYAKQIFENSMTKPQITLELWIEYVKSKEMAIKRKRGKNVEITQRMVDSDFNALFKLQELGVELEPRIFKAIDMKYQSFWYDSDNIAWKRHGGHFRNNVGHLEYNQSKNPNNPLAKIEISLDDLVRGQNAER